MPIIRKVLKVGNSRAVSLPSTWIQFYEEQSGEELKQVAVEVNGSLKIFPIKNPRIEQRKAARPPRQQNHAALGPSTSLEVK